MSLLLQFSHRLSCVVVVYLVLATIYGRLLYGVGGRFPIWEGRGVVPGSTGVPRVACPWVRCRAPPGNHVVPPDPGAPKLLTGQLRAAAATYRIWTLFPSRPLSYSQASINGKQMGEAYLISSKACM